MFDLIKRYWRTINRPSAYFSLGFLTLGGFVAGVVFWGAFNTAMEVTNTEAFCTGCHETVSYTHLTLPTILRSCRSRWSPYH